MPALNEVLNGIGVFVLVIFVLAFIVKRMLKSLFSGDDGKGGM